MLRLRRCRVVVASVARPPRARRALDDAAGQARAVASTITGERPYDEAPYFWSDQFGLRLQHVGHASAGMRSCWTGRRNLHRALPRRGRPPALRSRRESRGRAAYVEPGALPHEMGPRGTRPPRWQPRWRSTCCCWATAARTTTRSADSIPSRTCRCRSACRWRHMRTLTTVTGMGASALTTDWPNRRRRG